MDNRENDLFGDDLTFNKKIDDFSHLKDNTIDFLRSERSEKEDMTEKHKETAPVDDFLNFHDDLGDEKGDFSAPDNNQFSSSNNPVLLPTIEKKEEVAKQQPEIDFNTSEDDYLNPYAMNTSFNDTTNEKFISSEDLLTDFKDPIVETKKEVPEVPKFVEEPPPKETPVFIPQEEPAKPEIVIKEPPKPVEEPKPKEPEKAAPEPIKSSTSSSSNDTQIEAEKIFKSIGLDAWFKPDRLHPKLNLRVILARMTTVLYSILGFLIFENLVELYLTFRQLRVYKTSKKVPEELKEALKEDVFEKARLYGIDKAEFEIFKSILCDIIIVSVELYCGFIAYLWNESIVYTGKFHLNPANEIHVSCIFLLVVNVIGIFKDLPFSIYSTFVLEEKHGFNKQTASFFIKDQLKAFAVGQAISIPIVACIVWIVQIGGDYFFVWLWAFVGIISMLLITFYPVYIAPLFDKFRPLEEGKLRKSIEELAASLSFPIGQLLVVEGSKRSHHSNAYFTGLWGVKRIVLFDTLLLNKGLADDSTLAEDEKGKGCTDEEVLAVLAHELGHWKLGHMTKNIVIMQVQLFIIFMMFAYLFKFDALYEAVGFTNGKQPIIVGFLVIIMYVLAPFNTVVSFGMTLLSRKFEYQADAFAKQLGFASDLCKSLIKLHIDNLGFPIYDYLYSSWNHSHPTLLQRMSRLKDDSEDEFVKSKLHKKVN